MEAAVIELKNKAEKGRILYNQGAIEQAEAKTMVMPYIDAVNKKSKELAKKYNQRPRLVSFRSFVR